MSERKDIPFIPTLELFEFYSKLARSLSCYMDPTDKSNLRMAFVMVSVVIKRRLKTGEANVFSEYEVMSDMLDAIEKCGYEWSSLSGCFVQKEDDFEPEDFTDALLHELDRACD